VSVAAISFDFDPVLLLGSVAIRLETLGVAVAVLVALLIAARIVPADAGHPRLEDLLLLTLGIIPGAVVGGRLGYVLGQLDFYRSQPSAIVDPTQGSLDLGLAVAGGILTGAYVARLLGGSVGRWLDVATVPTLLALALGKAAMALGGRGQGAPSELPWATAYAGPGPWASLAPAVASHPSQLYESVATLAVLVAVVVATIAVRRAGRVPDPGVTFLIAIAGWAILRAVVASTWRDASIAIGLRSGQLIALGIAAVLLLAALVIVVRATRRYRVPSTSSDSAPIGDAHAADAVGREGEVGS
jgi:prolipoprotein diacylglyceryltransferase